MIQRVRAADVKPGMKLVTDDYGVWEFDNLHIKSDGVWQNEKISVAISNMEKRQSLLVSGDQLMNVLVDSASN